MHGKRLPRLLENAILIDPLKKDRKLILPISFIDMELVVKNSPARTDCVRGNLLRTPDNVS